MVETCCAVGSPDQEVRAKVAEVAGLGDAIFTGAPICFIPLEQTAEYSRKIIEVSGRPKAKAKARDRLAQ